MTYEAIVLEKKDSVAWVTINQPNAMNCLVKEVLDELSLATAELAEDESVKAIVLTGAGKAFCAGGDINRFKQGFGFLSGMDYVDGVHRFLKDWMNLKKPVIAMVNGPAMGAGMSLALACDIIIASEEAKFGASFISMGLIPDVGAAYFLPRIVGINKAKEILFTGKILDCEEALEVGIVNRIVPSANLAEEVAALTARLAKGPGFAISCTKRILNSSQDLDFSSLLILESTLQSMCFQTEDSNEAVKAFFEKRRPEFKGL